MTVCVRLLTRCTVRSLSRILSNEKTPKRLSDADRFFQMRGHRTVSCSVFSLARRASLVLESFSLSACAPQTIQTKQTP